MVSRRRLALVPVAALFLSIVVAPAHATAPAKPKPMAPTDHQVTLITGDRVLVHGDDLSVQPGPGRAGIPFETHRSKGRLQVIPADVTGQLASGRLDRRLFDVTGLIEAGYDDKAATAIPLIMTYTGRAKRAAKVPAATVTRQLPSVNGTAVKVAKANGGSFLKQNATGTKIWLDGKRKLTLDQSVPQIGAPAAWQAGYTGKGVSVAVLDGGIDTTHPDLAAQVAGEKNFTTASTPDDMVGHGTHVASTIAGTAAGSDGRYKGVAPDATLYDGKVCEYQSCSESALLAGMEWAATEVKAKIVSISIGGTDTPELDPLEEAVNRLTAQTGTLFVIAAGNDGSAGGTINSPGSADAALTVGAVDKSDQLAWFSSRGPRVGDGAIKPDVTAPGVDIVAAKAKNAYIGEPVGDNYLKLSGTSMATPHVAGAAALLAQAHPDWKAPQLKAVLMSSAKSIDGQSLFEQGSGRVDVAQAIKQTVVSEPSSVSFGLALWPHDDDVPVTRTITYRNLGTATVTLDLSATLTGPGGPAPEGAIKLSATSVTVPAGGTSSVDLTSDTRHDGQDGRYAGKLVATADGTTVATSLALEKEAGERYSVTVQQIGLDGGVPAISSATLMNVETGAQYDFSHPSGTATVRVPSGEYILNGSQSVLLPDNQTFDAFRFVQPRLLVDKDAKVVMDARTTKPVKVTVPRAGAVAAVAAVGFTRTMSWGPYTLTTFVSSFDHLWTAQLGPDVPADVLTGFVTGQWGKPAGNGFRNSPYLYSTLDSFPGKYPTGFTRTAAAGDFAVIDQSVNATSDRTAELLVYGRNPGVSGSVAEILNYDLPARRTVYVDADTKWQTQLNEVVEMPGWPFPDAVTTLQTVPRTYQVGRSYRERLNAAGLGPAPEHATRDQAHLKLSLPGLSDADGHFGESLTDTASGQLYRNGEPIGFEFPWFGRYDNYELPAEKADYKYITSLTRPSYSKLSSRIDYSWSFSSSAADKVLPMLAVRYQPAVDGTNTAARPTVTTLPVQVVAQPGQPVPAVRKAELAVSGDGGATWKNAPLVPLGGGKYQAVFGTPAGSAVSLKAKIVDAAGNVTEQTVIGAYLLK